MLVFNLLREKSILLKNMAQIYDLPREKKTRGVAVES